MSSESINSDVVEAKEARAARGGGGPRVPVEEGLEALLPSKLFDTTFNESPTSTSQPATTQGPPPLQVPSLSLEGAGFALSYGVLGTENGKDHVYWHFNPGPRIYSRKIFIGGLPIDIGEEELQTRFGKFGKVFIDWPYKSSVNRPSYPPKGLSGYVFLIYEEEKSVHALVDYSHKEDQDRYFLCLSSSSTKDKPVQVRPWRLADSDFLVNQALPLDPRKSVFVGSVPRPMKAVELAHIMERLYGGVAYAGIDTDGEFQYPKGAGRVIFSSDQSYVAAISAPFVQFRLGDMEKRVEVKPYVLEQQRCDECGGGTAPFFCPSIACLRYFCDGCWTRVHSGAGRDGHRALVKDANDRPRSSRFHNPFSPRRHN